MRQNIFIKSFTFGIVLLFFSASFSLNIKSENLNEQNKIDINGYLNSSITEKSEVGFDLEIIDIVPYLWEKEGTLFGVLRISVEIKNIGNAPVYGAKYFANSSYFLNNKRYGSSWGSMLMGSIEPGETWIPKGGAGLFFVNYIPRIFNIEFEVSPTDSTPDNNYIRQIYLARGGGLVPFYKHMPLLEFL